MAEQAKDPMRMIIIRCTGRLLLEISTGTTPVVRDDAHPFFCFLGTNLAVSVGA